MTGRKSVIVSGGAHGIGEAAVLAFAREGYRVALADVDQEAGERVTRTSARWRRSDCHLRGHSRRRTRGK